MRYFAFVALAFLVVVSGCVSVPSDSQSGDSSAGVSSFDWRNASFTDARTGEEFKISDFEGRFVLLESFAVWCPTCVQQQKELKKFFEEDDSIVHVSLDTDPNEDIEKVKEHISSYNFKWYFAVSPAETTQALIDEFGLQFVNAPNAPVALICPDQSARFLPSGVKTVERLKLEIAAGC